jgi:hypothetical protein
MRKPHLRGGGAARLFTMLALTLLLPAAALGEEPDSKPQQPIKIGPSNAKTSLFGLPGNGSKFLYVVDTSESMRIPKGKPLASAKEEIIASIDKLDKLTEFYIIHYNNVARLLDVTGGRHAFGTDENKQAAKQAIEAIQTGPRTEHEPAILMALKMHPDVLWLITDGDDPELTARDLARINRVNDARTIIHCVQFGKGQPKRGEEWLKKLASQNRGEYKFVDVSQEKAN